MTNITKLLSTGTHRGVPPEEQVAAWPVTDLVAWTDRELAARAVETALAPSVDDVAERLRLLALVEVEQEVLARRQVPCGPTLPMSAQGCYAQWVAYVGRRRRAQ